MTDVKDLLAQASAPLRSEADALRDEIAQEEQAFAERLAPDRARLAELDAAVARIEGKPAGRSRGTGRAPRGHNRTLILDALRAKPGMSAAEVADATGIAKPTVFATLDKLYKDKIIDKNTKAKPIEHSLK